MEEMMEENLKSTAKNLFDDIEDESEDALLDACMDAELEAAGSPLMTVPTPNGERCPRERLSHASTFTNYSSSAGQHIAVIVRVRPPPIDEAVCVDWQEAASQIVVQPPVGAVEEQLAPTTPGGRMPVPPRTPGRTPGGNGGGRTPTAAAPRKHCASREKSDRRILAGTVSRPLTVRRWP
jgi:hypothetical protein